MTTKTAEQIKQAKADAFEYGMGKFLRKIGVKTAEEVQQFLQIASQIAQDEAQKKA